jgi:hypothetical protein
MGVTLGTYVTLVLNIIFMCHWSSNASLEDFFNKVEWEGGGGQKVLSRPLADSFAIEQCWVFSTSLVIRGHCSTSYIDRALTYAHMIIMVFFRKVALLHIYI